MRLLIVVPWEMWSTMYSRARGSFWRATGASRRRTPMLPVDGGVGACWANAPAAGTSVPATSRMKARERLIMVGLALCDRLCDRARVRTGGLVRREHERDRRVPHHGVDAGAGKRTSSGGRSE